MNVVERKNVQQVIMAAVIPRFLERLSLRRQCARIQDYPFLRSPVNVSMILKTAKLRTYRTIGRTRGI